MVAVTNIYLWLVPGSINDRFEINETTRGQNDGNAYEVYEPDDPENDNGMESPLRG